ncbi:MAG TPA: NfeD family protein [Thermoanaerobaculia bacterium]|jgi:membrane protein implicated in regulation of membrane protease activity|nr:NfeD family protein [Thermoanaerobaculia bacterium]
MVWWLWVIVGFILLATEFATTTMHVAFFAIGAFVVGILVGVGLDLPLWAQLVIFTSVSLFAFFFLRPIAVRKLKLDQKKVVDSLVGEQATAMEEIAPQAVGRAELRGTTWSARNVGETVLNRGQRCVVTEVEGLTIHIRTA